jgi:Zn-dependent metalloprotease
MLLVCSGLVLAQGVSDATTTAPSRSAAPTKAASAASGFDRSLAERLRDNARGSVSLSKEAATQHVGFVVAGRNGDLMPGTNARAVDKARSFLDTYGPLLGATDPSQLAQVGRDTDTYGTTVTYRQSYRGLPVFGGMLRAHLDRDGSLTAVNGTAIPDINLSTTPNLSSSKAAAMAVRDVRVDPPTNEKGRPGSTEGIRAASTQLMVYRTGLTFGRDGDNQLAYAVEVTNGSNVRDMLYLNAGSGKLLNRYSLVDDAMERHVYERSYDPSNPTATEVYKEGDPVPGTLNQDQENIVRASGEAYHFFQNSFGYDSYDNAGAPMRTVNNDPRISCPNANWNGRTTNYCNGVTADDVVAHEWGHAYTQYNSGLIYQWQPGALNESYSDIWGETIDLINDRMDTDEGNIDAKRAVGACSTHYNPRPVLVINSPASIARTCQAAPASFGPAVTESGTSGDVALAVDAADAAGPSTTDGCSTITSNVNGKIALLDRGTCGFAVKVKNAQNAGATAVVVGQNNPFAPTAMGGGDPTITIPSLMISQTNRNAIASELSANHAVNVTLSTDPATRQDSYRWLIGEDATAFGSAIRDMWTPTCLNMPGKVSDAEYYCATDDAGGVHRNSGVNNHAYALLVDGGTYNDRTVNGIGLTKAAHIFWRAQTEYQVPTTDFADQAAALASSCNDLTGQQVPGLSVDGSPEQGAPSTRSTQSATITADDCAQVAAVSAAVEYTKEPTQCNFQPLLAKNAPAPCAAGEKANLVWTENFEDGLAGWTVSSQARYAGGPTFPWAATTDLPKNDPHPGTTAFAEDAEGGQCDATSADHSGVTRLQSPSIVLPGATQKAPRVTFQHYMAAETGADGGNLKVSINGGAFTVVPASAYTFNKPTTILPASAGNTNPLAGEAGFTGTDGGQVTGSWGESQVDLTMIGVKPGDSIQLRFDFGQDGCTGVDGWYVDDVKVLTCRSKSAVAAEPTATASRPARSTSTR